VNKAAGRAAQLAKCILLYAYSRTTVAPSYAGTNKNFIYRYLIKQADILCFLLKINKKAIKVCSEMGSAKKGHNKTGRDKAVAP